MTRIGVCIPTYNRADDLGRLLESIAPGVAVFVSDNGDHLPQEFRDRFPAVTFSGTAGPAVGMFANWNRAARMADSEWLLVPSDDDIYYPGAFDQIDSAISAHPGAGILVFGHHIVDESYAVRSTWVPEAGSVAAPGGFERFRFGVDARMPSIAIRRSAIEQLGWFDERFVYAAADSDLVQRALLAVDAVFVPAVVAGYRVWPGSATRATLATPGWLADVDHWGSKIEALLRRTPRLAAQARLVHDELYATNLLAGLYLLRAHGEKARLRAHFRASRYPHHARWRTQLRLLLQVLRTLGA